MRQDGIWWNVTNKGFANPEIAIGFFALEAALSYEGGASYGSDGVLNSLGD